MSPASWEAMGSRLRYLTMFPCSVNDWASQQTSSQCCPWSSGAQLATRWGIFRYLGLTAVLLLVSQHHRGVWEKHPHLVCSDWCVLCWQRKGRHDLWETWRIIFFLWLGKNSGVLLLLEESGCFSACLIHFPDFQRFSTKSCLGMWLKRRKWRELSPRSWKHARARVTIPMKFLESS